MKNLLELTQHCTLIASPLMLCSLKICQELKTVPHQLSTHVPYFLSYSLSFTFDYQAVTQTSLPVYQGLAKYILPPPTLAFHPNPLFTTLVTCTCIIHPYIHMQLVLNDCLTLKMKVLWSSDASLTVYHLTQQNIPEDLNLLCWYQFYVCMLEMGHCSNFGNVFSQCKLPEGYIEYLRIIIVLCIRN